MSNGNLWGQKHYPPIERVSGAQDICLHSRDIRLSRTEVTDLGQRIYKHSLVTFVIVMKPLSLLFTLGIYLSCFTYVYTIKCLICDPDVEGDCKDVGIDCEDDPDLGHAFDSCYISDIFAEDKNGTVYTHRFKYCGIKAGCQLMTDMRCEDFNDTYKNLVNLQCKGICCDEHDYCNVDQPLTAGTADQPRTTEAAKPDVDVQGYKSNSPTQVLPCTLLVLTSWIFALPKF